MVEQKEISLILHDIRSAHNVGAIFRTADAIGVSKIYLTGYTPAPLDRFGRVQKDIAKTALGAEKTVSWERGEIEEMITILKKKGVSIIAVEQDKNAIDYKNFTSPPKIALVLGNEVEGLGRSVLPECDAVIEIPMRGKKESLNVSVAAGIILYRLFDT